MRTAKVVAREHHLRCGVRLRAVTNTAVEPLATTAPRSEQHVTANRTPAVAPAGRSVAVSTSVWGDGETDSRYSTWFELRCDESSWETASAHGCFSPNPHRKRYRMRNLYAMCPMNVAPPELVEQVLELVRMRSLRRAQIEWESFTTEFLDRAATCLTLQDAHDLIREMLTRLADGHSFLRTASDMEGRDLPLDAGLRLHNVEPVVIDVYPDSPAARQGLRMGDRITRVEDQPVTADNWQRLRRAALSAGSMLDIETLGRPRSCTLVGGISLPMLPPEGRLVAPGVGLIDLPGHDGNGTLSDGQRYDGMLASLLRRFERAGAARWIVDLRRCDGGNMWPLLAGLVPLLGQGTYGAFVDPVADTWLDWGFDGTALRVTNRRDPSETYQMMEVPSMQPLDNQDAPVALLTSPVTSSSGEAVLISFLGRAKTRTFGQPTGGLTTSNNLHVLLDGSWLLLAENLEADRNDVVREGRIEPDFDVEIDWSLFGLESDPCIQAALGWLELKDDM